MTRRRLLPGLAALLARAACGRKPDFVDPPADLEVDTFPRQYPAAEDPADDPASGGGRRTYPAS